MCSHGGGRCPNDAIKDGLCAAHQKQRKVRTAEVQKIYSGVHKRLRIEAFRRDGWTCKRCGWMPPTVKLHREFPGSIALREESVLSELTALYHRGMRILEAHHLVALDVNPTLAESLENYETICSACHDKETGARREWQ